MVGVDVILDHIGASYLKQNIESLNFDGRLFIIGTIQNRDWSSPNAELVLPSQVGGVELLQDGPEHLLSQWKHNVVNPSGFFSW